MCLMRLRCEHEHRMGTRPHTFVSTEPATSVSVGKQGRTEQDKRFFEITVAGYLPIVQVRARCKVRGVCCKCSSLYSPLHIVYCCVLCSEFNPTSWQAALAP